MSEVDKALSEDKTVDTAQKIKLGDKEYTKEELEAATTTKAELDEWSEKNGDWRSLKAEYTKNRQEVAEIENKAKLAKDISDGTKKASDLTESELEDLAYIKKLVPELGTLNVDEIITKAKEEAKKEFEAELNSKKVVETVETEIKAEVAKYPFVKEEDLRAYLEERATKGLGFLSPHQAVLIKYEEQISESNKKPGDLPAFETSNSKGRPETPIPPKPVELGSPELSNRIHDRLFGSKHVE